MSLSRTSDVNTDNKSTQKENVSLWKVLQVGVAAGFTKSTVLFPLDKFCYHFQTEEGISSWAQTFNHLRAQGFAKGYPICVATAVISQITLLITQPLIKNKLEQNYPRSPVNEFVSGGLAGAISTYAYSPLHVVKTLRMTNKSYQDIWQIPTKVYYNGVHTKAGMDSAQAGLFFYFRSLIGPHLQNSTVAGAISGLIASLFTNPLATIMTRQRSKKELAPFIKTVLEIYEKKGLVGFYPKFLSSTGLRTMLSYGILNTAIDYLKLFSKNSQDNNQNTCSEEEAVEKPRRSLR